MKINFTKKEYRALVTLLELGDWLMHAHIPSPQTDRYMAVKQRLLAYYKEMGAEDMIEYAQDLDEYFLNQDTEQTLRQEFIEPYEEECFWDQLIYRLAVKDLIQQIGQQAYQAMEPQERMQRLETISHMYAEEFHQQGLERLNIDTGTNLQSTE